MRICVLQPSYAGSSCDYQHYDQRRDLSHLLPEHEFHHEFLDKVSAFSQIKALQRQGFDVYVNLCEGYRDSDVPSIDVIHALEDLNLPFTGPSSRLYDPPKDLMKLVAISSGVGVPAWEVVDPGDDVLAAASALRLPLFVKPSAYGDSMGIDEHSLVATPEELQQQVAAKLPEFGRLLVEEYVDGREFTVLVMAGPDPARPPAALTPIEFIFPPGPHFKTYDLKVTQFHPECNVPCTEPGLADRLKAAAIQVFTGFTGEGYARMDFRVDAAGRIFFLEANFTCSVFYPEGYQGSADYILAFDGIGQAGFLRAIIDEGLARHARRQLPYAVKPSGDGFAMFAARDLACGSVAFEGEGKRTAHRHALPRRADVVRRGPRGLLPLRLSHQPGRVRPLGHGTDGLGAAEPLVRPQHRVCGPQPRGAARHPQRRGADGRLRDVLRPPHDAVRLRRAAAATAAAACSAGAGGCSGSRGRRLGAARHQNPEARRPSSRLSESRRGQAAAAVSLLSTDFLLLASGFFLQNCVAATPTTPRARAENSASSKSGRG